jgi:hypothetical protein
MNVEDNTLLECFIQKHNINPSASQNSEAAHMCDFTLCCGQEGRPLSEERNILVYGNKILRGKFESKGMSQ